MVNISILMLTRGLAGDVDDDVSQSWVSNKSLAPTLNIGNIQSMDADHECPVSAIPLPEEGYDEGLVLKISGNSLTFNFTWVLGHDPNTSPFVNIDQFSESPYARGRPSPVEATEIFWAINDYFIPRHINSSYELVLGTRPNGQGVLGVISGFNGHIEEQATDILRGNLSFTVGKPILAGDLNTPEDEEGDAEDGS